ncbi:hypothetical protein A6V36_28805 [Paraburkholderia ginsengiterrae]|uniref:Xylulose 5-phosphate/Fructose 6-phosphate phosphoketolase N-terminal domain-containing protein n=1 Tax=Paraburkholderia ginsengiterrae TaxID=1462993 RepID=A0A1A9N0Y7_9BURK|nr:hypothetical protein [Paraburkholderia ginsengiterrae]OAJ53501.1 hypothetical protein A6V37_08950 [Paraburkholderia ginsengiterrae]OAJ59053.1 hypothetical protein A6V36_28805 [Paraburkholderia ginsengiterrae]
MILREYRNDLPLSADQLYRIDAWWRAANYLSVGQIYLLANPLLREPLEPAHVKPRLLGHWGTTPGLNFIYVHLNRLINEHDIDMLFIAGPGHGGPAALANAWLEGTYSETYANVPQDAAGMATLFRQFSFPGGVPSHVSAHTPGSIHEGGELGYSLSHAFGAAFDHPNLIVACVVGDGEAETGPLATAWHSNKFLNPATGIGIWEWASNDAGSNPDVVMACAGDVPTLETLAAVDLLHAHLPALRVRVVNVVDLMTLESSTAHPHGLSDDEFDTLFTVDRPVIFAHHSYPALIHRLTYRRRNHANFHVHGFIEEGATTTPFDMTVLNRLDRFHLCEAVIDHVEGLASQAAHVRQAMRDKLVEHRQYVDQHGDDLPEIRNWRWLVQT